MANVRENITAVEILEAHVRENCLCSELRAETIEGQSYYGVVLPDGYLVESLRRCTTKSGKIKTLEFISELLDYYWAWGMCDKFGLYPPSEVAAMKSKIIAMQKELF